MEIIFPMAIGWPAGIALLLPACILLFLLLRWSKRPRGPIQLKILWLQFWLEKPLELWLEIPYTKK